MHILCIYILCDYIFYVYYIYVCVLYAFDLTCLSRSWSMPGARSILWWVVLSKYLRNKFIPSRKRDCFATIVLLRNNVSWLQGFWTLWRLLSCSRMFSEHLVLVKCMFLAHSRCPTFCPKVCCDRPCAMIGQGMAVFANVYISTGLRCVPGLAVGTSLLIEW